MQPSGVINKEARLLAVALGEMVGGDLERFVDTLADSDTGHHDDELRPAVTLVHLEHSLDVAIGLARAGLHLDIEIELAAGAGGQLVGDRQILPLLDVLYIAEHLKVRQDQVSVLETLLERAHLCLATWINPIGDAAHQRLTGKAVHYRVNSLSLIGLDLEFQLHGHLLRST
ncbi:hypothetical protein DM15PD_17280 [Aristophania vespae]|nr:hypothetical protein DM15PD_17280 [Aristophania vespae]